MRFDDARRAIADDDADHPERRDDRGGAADLLGLAQRTAAAMGLQGEGRPFRAHIFLGGNNAADYGGVRSPTSAPAPSTGRSRGTYVRPQRNQLSRVWPRAFDWLRGVWESPSPPPLSPP
jgi:hypothetical protein